MSYLIDLNNIKVTEKVTIKCDYCEKEKTMLLISAKRNAKRNNDKHKCISCSAKENLKPQNYKSYWENDEIKKKHSECVKSSKAYREGIKNRPSVAGEKNPMWGRTHTPETKAKMSASRIGKTGENATNWKGGKLSINRRVKSALQRNHKWFHRIMERDNCTCQICGANKNLDAHHITPISRIIKELMENKMFLTDSEKIDWLLLQPEIIDNDLKNGVTLCRSCHKKVHKNWGSHEPKV